jgi:alanyl aminopeptidase
VPFVADEGQDAVLAAEARQLADAWLADRRSVDAEIVEAVLGVAAARGDVALFEKWHEAARKADRMDRGRLLVAIGSIPDPSVLKRAMAITLQDDFEPRESMMILAAARSVPTSRAQVYDFVKSNFDALEARLPPDSTAGFPAYASAVCDESVIADAERFFKDRSTRVRGGPRSLAQSLESLRLCVALRKTQAASVADFLERYPGKDTAVFRFNGKDERR